MSFAARFGREPDAAGTAPARVNLIGEHTDYNGGYVLPLAFGLETRAEVAVRTDRTVRAVSASRVDGGEALEYARGAEARTGTWIDYIQGVTDALDQSGHDVPGFDLYVDTTVPIGAGLSSSASLTVAVLRALRTACRLPLSDFELAMAAHRAETGIVGAPVGVMDQLAVSLGDPAHALFIDTRQLKIDRVPWPASAGLVIVHSGVTHDHSSGDYRTRRSECDDAARRLGVELLSDLSEADLPRIATLPAPLDRRVRHVITENVRVLAAVDAMRAEDLRRLGALWLESHASQRDDFQTSLPVIDALVQTAAAVPGVHGARLTGGGFGGAVIVVCDATAVAAVAQTIRSTFHATSRKQPHVLWPL